MKYKESSAFSGGAKMTKTEFERLQPGQIIQHKKDNKWVFIVHQNFGERLTAVRTIEVRDPENWDMVTKVQVEKPEPKHEQTTLEKSAQELHELLKQHNWYHSTGIGNNELFIYTSKRKHPKPYNDFCGFPVNYKYMGKIAPL